MTNEELEAIRIVVSGWRTRVCDNPDEWYGDIEAWYAIKYTPALLAEVERLQAELATARRWAAAWKNAAKLHRGFCDHFLHEAQRWQGRALRAQLWAFTWKRAAKWWRNGDSVHAYRWRRYFERRGQI